MGNAYYIGDEDKDQILNKRHEKFIYEYMEKTIGLNCHSLVKQLGSRMDNKIMIATLDRNKPLDYVKYGQE
jgi:hypothetical protein